MIKTVYINTIEDILPLITEVGYLPGMDRYRGHYIYRGLPDASYKLITSLDMNCRGLKTELEPAILRNFAKYAVLDDPEIGRSVWKQMVVGQHHGLPTRLLDWSHSCLVGLHFAVTEEHLDRMDQRDGVVWRIDMKEMVRLMPEKYRAPLEKNDSSILSVDQLARITDSLEQYDRDMGDHAMAIVEPPSTEARIVNQYSFFSVIPSGMEDIETFLDKNTEHTVRYVISRDIRWHVRDLLDQMNISERIVYPGLDGLSRWLARHYYVKASEEKE